MRLRPEAKVGLIVILAFAALTITYWFFGRLVLQTGHYTLCAEFDDVMRLAKGADVRMAGVRLGAVKEIELVGRRARILLTIDRKYRDAIPNDSTARITTGGLVGVGEYYVEILPGTSRVALKPGQCVKTVKLPNLDDVMAKVTGIIDDLQSSMQHINDVLEDPKTRAAFQDVMENIQLTTERAAALTGEFQEILAENRPEINRAMAGVNSTIQEFAVLSRELRVAMETGGFPQIQAALNNVVKITDNLANASKQLSNLSEDKQLQSDIKKAVSSAREAAEGVAAIVGRAEDVIGGRKRNNSDSRSSESRYIPELGFRTDAFLLSDDIDFRLDLNYTLAGGDDRFYRLGLYDLGEDNRLNLQLGNSLDDRSALRYGLYASKLGVGYDRIIGRDLSVHFDLYRPNSPRLEAKFKYDFSPNLGAWGGVTNVFDEPEALFGVQYRK